VAGLSADLPARDAARVLTAARLLDVRHRGAALVREPSADAVHDLRVALRRLRAALQLFGAAHRWSDELRELMRPLGDCRDAQLRLEWLRAASETAGVLVELEQRRLEVELPAAVARVSSWLQSRASSYQAAAAGLAPRGRFGGHRLRERLAALRRRVARREEALDSDPAPRPAHRLRIAVKKLRYAAELLLHADPGAVRRLLGELADLQAILGDLHDADVRIEWLSAAHAAPPAERRRLLARAQAERVQLARKLLRQLD